MSLMEMSQPTMLVAMCSDEARRIIRLIDKVGRTRWLVLLIGETGIGKGLVAQNIHDVEGHGRFVTIDCSVLSPQLIESELFGHERGAFTGATERKTGLFAMADGGTAFLDEIGELPLDLQAKLLRVLQEKEFRPLGSVTSRRSDFRLISATNRDLGEAVDKGTFRADLYYRINVTKLRIPPLRERKGDIPELARHFMNRYGSSHTLAPETMQRLIDYNWPGNIRELESCIQHMIATSSGRILQPDMMPSQFKEPLVCCQTGLETSIRSKSTTMTTTTMPLSLDELEHKAIMDALSRTAGSHSQTARLLGISRTTLHRRLKAFARRSATKQSGFMPLSIASDSDTPLTIERARELVRPAS
jgi:transcriptional regulator with PAS, ATPase and Fis domain